jgi:predicted enzyme related to lactoylglutathione lyase
MSRVIHFEIHADDPERAVKFYTNIFGWEIKKWEGPTDYWIIKTGDEKQPGIDGGLMKRKPSLKGEAILAFPCTIDVPSVDKYVKMITENGGDIEMPKSPIPGIGWVAYCHDTENNLFSILENDLNAK